ncbi:MAG: DNA polymerase III subunit gamma/tau [Candidatus Peribacteraceae bacterium]|nr:DNA polymerase III subunit gamma/tau [Candidatus Peribacteraceae bacterium]
MSLYRQYRPQSFADVIGQDHIVTTLEQAAAQEKLAHAYLFAGSRGTGKTSVARILAKTIMVRNIRDEAVKKQIVKGVEEGNIVDLLEIDAASNRGIDDIRDLVEKIQFSPVAAGAKVYIIDEVHMLTKEAFNALLKTLEEPPPYAFFILATTELSKIPVTIQSRCQCFPFRHIRDDDIIRRLQYIVDCEKIIVEREALRAIARHAEGGMRDAIALLDQLRSLEKITVADVQERIGSTGNEYIEDIFRAIDAKDAQSLVTTLKILEENGVPTDVFLRQLLSVVRRKLRHAIMEGEQGAYLIGIVDALLQAIRDIRSSPLPGLALEAALLSICCAEDPGERLPLSSAQEVQPEPTKENVAEKKEKKTGERTAKKDVTEKEEALLEEKEKEKEKEEKLGKAIVEAVELSLKNVQEQWPNVVAQAEPASVRMSLKDGHVQGIEGNTVIVTFGSAFHRDKVTEMEASRKVEQLMEKIFKRSLRLKCTIDASGTNGLHADGGAVNLADAAAEIF